MKRIDFYFDFISPYAYLAFERLPEALAGLNYMVDYRPVLFAGLLKHHGQLGPAEIPHKRDWTYRQSLWLAHQYCIPLDLPAAHPFNPLALLRLALRRGDEDGRINRHVAQAVFRHVWRGGADAVEPARIAALAAVLELAQDSIDAAPKERLKANTDAAIAQGVFGVPLLKVDDKSFWGFDALPMLRAYLNGDAWFAEHWQAAVERPAAVARSSKKS